jgi:hypothetical protein
MNDRHKELIDETTLRRALRFDADERLPSFDPAAIAAAAERPRLAAAMALIAVAVTAAGAAVVWSAFAILAPAVMVQGFDFVMGLIAVLAVPARTITDVVQQPAVPLSLLAALAIATAYEWSERRVAHAAVR